MSGDVADDAAVRALFSGETFLSRVDLGQRDLRGTHSPGADLSGIDLRGALLTEANLHGADLRNCDLTEADLHKAVLSEANLGGAKLDKANLEQADLRGANVCKASLEQADLVGAALGAADLTGAFLMNADLSFSKCQRAIFREANLSFASFFHTDLTGAELTNANLTGATLIQTPLGGATLRGCRVYGASVWDVDLTGAVQTDLIAGPGNAPDLVTDSLEVAQFLYLLLKNPKVREVIDTIGKKAVLILGSFSPERKGVLDAVREALRARGWVPILFDFEVPATRDITETVSTLAHLSRFVIADLTNPRSLPQELTRIVPILPSLAVQPIIHASQDPWAMFGDLRRYPWVLEPYRYESAEGLVAGLEAHVVGPAEAKARELTGQG